MMRLRLQVLVCPRRALALTDTPRPHCVNCHGMGGIPHAYGDETGEYAGTDWEFCPCWSPWRLTLLPLPHWLRRTPHGYSSEPPF